MPNFYPIAHWLSSPGRDYMAVPTGEFRPPKGGEWYLSGAIIEAYKANADMSGSYHIARLVKVKRTLVIEEA